MKKSPTVPLIISDNFESPDLYSSASLFPNATCIRAVEPSMNLEAGGWKMVRVSERRANGGQEHAGHAGQKRKQSERRGKGKATETDKATR